MPETSKRGIFSCGINLKERRRTINNVKKVIIKKNCNGLTFPTRRSRNEMAIIAFTYDFGVVNKILQQRLIKNQKKSNHRVLYSSR